jgi:hypothetical protein
MMLGFLIMGISTMALSSKLNTVLFFHDAPCSNPVIIQEYEIRVDFRPISLFFGELGLERSKVFSIKESSELRAEEKAMEAFRKLYALDRAVVVGVVTE